MKPAPPGEEPVPGQTVAAPTALRSSGGINVSVYEENNTIRQMYL